MNQIINSLKTLFVYTTDLLASTLPRGYDKVILLALAEENNTGGEAINYSSHDTGKPESKWNRETHVPIYKVPFKLKNLGIAMDASVKVLITLKTQNIFQWINDFHEVKQKASWDAVAVYNS